MNPFNARYQRVEFIVRDIFMLKSTQYDLNVYYQFSVGFNPWFQSKFRVCFRLKYTKISIRTECYRDYRELVFIVLKLAFYKNIFLPKWCWLIPCFIILIHFYLGLKLINKKVLFCNLYYGNLCKIYICSRYLSHHIRGIWELHGSTPSGTWSYGSLFLSMAEVYLYDIYLAEKYKEKEPRGCHQSEQSISIFGNLLF